MVLIIIILFYQYGTMAVPFDFLKKNVIIAVRIVTYTYEIKYLKKCK